MPAPIAPVARSLRPRNPLTARRALAIALVPALLASVSPVLAAQPAAPAAASTPAQAETALPIIINDAQAKALIAAGAKVVDVRPAAAYEKGHIEGAISLPWIKLNQREADGIRNEFASDDVFQKVISEAGLSHGDTIIIYENSALPGRAYVALEYAGLGDKLYVLDGGVNAWTSPLSTAAVTPKPSNFTLANKKDIRVDKAYVESKLGAKDAVLIDGRDEEAYVDGHIPGAAGLPAATLLTKDRTLKSRPELVEIISSTGATPDKEVISYCGSGVYAANNYLALRNLGYDKVAFYDASWDEWSRDPKAGQEVSLANYGFNPPAAAAGKGAQSFDGIPVPGKANDGRPQFLTADELKARAADKKTVILDVRSPADYDWGHIPGSVNVFWNSTLNEDRTLKDLPELEKIYAAAGVTPDKDVIIYARGGFQLGHTFTALKLLGQNKVDFFTGKFEGWKSK